LLAAICEKLGAADYLSSLGSACYLVEEMDEFKRRGVAVSFQHYHHPQYEQLYPPFESHAAVLDLLFNEGPASLGILRSGRRTPLSPEAALRHVNEGVSTT
jgi:hypothetical protein